MLGFVVYIKAALALYVFLLKPQSSTKSLERQRKNATIHNSLRSVKQTAVWRLKPFPLRSKVIRLQLVYAPLIPTGEE